MIPAALLLIFMPTTPDIEFAALGARTWERREMATWRLHHWLSDPTYCNEVRSQLFDGVRDKDPEVAMRCYRVIKQARIDYAGAP